jgi:hypothetical protein
LTATTVGALSVTNDGSLTLKDGAATAGVTVTGTTGKQATFKVEKGTIASGTDATAAIVASTDAKVVISGGTITGRTSGAALQLTGKSEATISGSAELVSGTGNVVDIKSANADAGKATLNIEGSPVLRAAATGSVKGIAVDATTSTAVEINVKGGTIGKYTTTTEGKETSTELATAVDLKAGTLNISGGTFEGATSAIEVTNGKLNVTGAASFKGANVISATTKDSTPTINLTGAATYTATGKVDLDTPTSGFAIYNHDKTASQVAGITSLNIEAGTFVGDVISDQATHFISGGTFQNCDYLKINNHDYLYVVLGKTLEYNSSKGYFEVK